MSYSSDCREIRVTRSGSASDLNLIILLEQCLRGSSVVKLKRERGVLFALLLEKVYDSDIRKANESIKREYSNLEDLKNVRLELNEHASHAHTWWFPEGKKNNTSDARCNEGAAAKEGGSGWYGYDSDEEDSSGYEKHKWPVEEQITVYNKDSNYRNSESRSEKGAQSYNSNSSRRGYWSSLDSKMQERANEHGNNASKAKKGLRQFVVERCIVVQLTDVNQAEPALYHFENDEYGGSDIHHYAVNSRTKKMLLQFDCLDAVARVIKYGEHKVYGEVVSVQNACAEDLIDFTDCKVERTVLSEESDNEESEDEEDREVDPTATIVIKLPENLLTATDVIRFHFENEEYGGDDIKYLRLQPEKRRALVTFNNGKDVVDRVLSHPLHTVCGTKVEVRHCSPYDLAD